MVAAALERLFSTYQQFGRSDEPTDRIKAAAAYFEAVKPYELRDIDAAVTNFLNGSVPGVNASFAPPAPAVGAEVRRVMNLRLDSEQRRYAPRGSLPAPTIERTPDSMERVKAMMQQAVAGLTSEAPADDAEAKRRKQAFQSRVFDRFDPPQSEAEMRKRLHIESDDSDAEGDMGTLTGDAA